MKTIPPAQAEHQLTAVADRFDEWRQTRTTRAEPIPQRLWEQAIALTTMFSLARVATRLRVSGGELNARFQPPLEAVGCQPFIGIESCLQ